MAWQQSVNMGGGATGSFVAHRNKVACQFTCKQNLDPPPPHINWLMPNSNLLDKSQANSSCEYEK